MANWVSVALPDSDDPLSSDHFPFAFKTRNPKDLVSFTFSLLNEKVELTTFTDGEKKLLLISFKKQTSK